VGCIEVDCGSELGERAQLASIFILKISHQNPRYQFAIKFLQHTEPICIENEFTGGCKN
jgi:hypothetical protein